jgi:hypothetical protein
MEIQLHGATAPPPPSEEIIRELLMGTTRPAAQGSIQCFCAVCHSSCEQPRPVQNRLRLNQLFSDTQFSSANSLHSFPKEDVLWETRCSVS